jgi:hypothetical protein
MRSTQVTRASAFVLVLPGAALLFAPVEVLSRTVPDIPPAAAWLGQLLGAAWLALATMNWLARFTMVGGIYGRAIVSANAAAYFVSAMVMLSAGRRLGFSTPMLVITIVALVMAAVYGYLLFRGPFAADRVDAAPNVTAA